MDIIILASSGNWQRKRRWQLVILILQDGDMGLGRLNLPTAYSYLFLNASKHRS